MSVQAHQTAKQTIMPNLSGKTALVTGSSRGIGRASALALAAAGAKFWCITAVARLKLTVSSARYAKPAAAVTQS
jgi:NAD(P)-dependent dehydrogenase (short-subunit alcohol dehydrogenase family)